MLEKIAGKFNEDLDAIYTNIVFFKKENKFTRAWNVGQINSLSIKKGIYPPHTGLFVKKKIFENIGFYNENFKISSDIEFMHKLFENEKLKKSALYINSIKKLLCSYWRFHAVSTVARGTKRTAEIRKQVAIRLLIIII